ncbi:MAG: glycosyltransferase [Bacilli bacterium]|nr:glycosyltransferase [Bacilli bacterium]
MKNKYKLISIIVPVYNMEKYIDKCINSIINQTYKNIEIIIVDDGSTDKSSKIIDKYKKIDKRVKVYHKKNGGLADARNYGLEKATGEYIGFVDSDDYIENNMYKKLYNNLIKYKADISVVNYNLVYEKDFNYKKNFKEISDKLIILNKIETIKLLLDDNKFGNYAWNKLYKRELFNNIKYPIGRKMEDLGTTYKIIEKCNRIVYDPIPLYNYLQRNNSIVNTINLSFFEDTYILTYERFIYLDNKYGFIKENHFNTIRLLLFCYSFINDKDNTYKDVIKKIKLFKIIDKLSYKEKIKFIVLRINNKLFKLLFTKKDIF